MRVILAEKPSVARDIARVLGANESHKDKGFISGNGYAITWAFGHLVEIAQPEAMNQSWGKPWKAESLPLTPTSWRYEVLPDKQAQFENIRKLFNDGETSEIICATDAGREGELIFRLIYDQAGCTKPVRRLWISSLTDEAIKAGFANLKPSSEFEPLAAAASCRQRADWMYGLSLTRAFSLHNRAFLSAGRVQTPTLALVVRRDAEIADFKPSNFYELHSRFASDSSPFAARYIDSEGEYELPTLAKAESLKSQVDPIPHGIVRKVTKTEKHIAAPALFDLVTLQKESNRIHGYTAQETLNITQELYESKLVSYPRTESRHLSTTMLGELPGVLSALASTITYSDHAKNAQRALEAGLRLSKRYVDDAKLTDHHAIIPTSTKPASLSDRQRNIYDLIARRFLAVFYPDQLRAESEILIAVGDHTFRSFGSYVTQPGWTVVQTDPDQPSKPEEEEESQRLPDVDEGQQLRKLDTEIKTKQRKPPKPYTDATLLTAMKSAGKLVEDEELAEHMKHNGLGTAATRANIIEELVSDRKGYLVRVKTTLRATDKGKAFIAQASAASSDICDPVLTASWEQRLKRIEDAEEDPEAFDKDIRAAIANGVSNVFASRKLEASELAVQGDSGLQCPSCQKGYLRERKAGESAFYGCTGYKADKTGCNFRLPGELCSRKLSVTTIKQLCSSKRRSTLVKGLVSKKSGKSFDAFLKLTVKEGQAEIGFEFDNNKAKGKTKK